MVAMKILGVAHDLIRKPMPTFSGLCAHRIKTQYAMPLAKPLAVREFSILTIC
jgi:hypothetical protein